MSRDLVVREITPNVWTMVQQIAPAIHQSRFYGVASAEAAATVMLKGHELGLGLAASFEFIQIIQGKPSLTPRGALAIVLNSGLLGGLKIEETDDTCTVWMQRKGDPAINYQTSWSQADAERAGLVKPDSNWLKYPRNMRKWRAVGYCIDFLFSDVTGGLKRADEFGAAIDANGNVVEATWTEAPAQPAEQPKPPELAPPTTITLDDLLAAYSAEQIVAANEGRVPATDAELVAVFEKLAANG